MPPPCRVVPYPKQTDRRRRPDCRLRYSQSLSLAAQLFCVCAFANKAPYHAIPQRRGMLPSHRLHTDVNHSFQGLVQHCCIMRIYKLVELLAAIISCDKLVPFDRFESRPDQPRRMQSTERGVSTSRDLYCWDCSEKMQIMASRSIKAETWMNRISS